MISIINRKHDNNIKNTFIFIFIILLHIRTVHYFNGITIYLLLAFKKITLYRLLVG